MSIKSKLVVEDKAVFPRLMEWTEKDDLVVVLITEASNRLSCADNYYGKGMVVFSADSDWPVGYFSNSWPMNRLKDFDESVQLSNQ